MTKRIDRIIVLGGGSAGFMAAIALKSKLRDLAVTVIRSKELGIIGVGEGSTVPLTRFLHDYLAVGPRKFFEVARPTWKLGLKFLWGNRPYFNYTFGPGMDLKDPALPKANGFYCDRDMEFSDPYSALMTFDKIFDRRGEAPAVHLLLAYHFENEKFVEFLEGLAGALGVQVLDGTVTNVPLDDRGAVAELRLASGATASADLYVDASGFASALLGKALSEPFISFSSSLFCDRAVIGGWDRDSSDDPADQVVKPYTTCETMPSGWAWQIEHENRINRGYVYCSQHVGDEQAQREFRDRNPRVGPTRVVPFVSGRYRNAWSKNVVAVGNASGFVEPLEATALGVIAMQSRILTETLRESEREIRPTQVAMFNQFNAQNWDSIRGFLALHYKFNRRLDTPFWQRCREETELTPTAQRVVDFYRENGPTAVWGSTLLSNEFDQFTIGGYVTMLTGMQVPYRTTYVPTERELQTWEARRRQHREAAARAMAVREALAVIRSPKWNWGQ